MPQGWIRGRANRTGRDFAALKRNKATGRAARTFAEVKNSSAELSPAQRRAMKAYGRRYVAKRM